jgi:mRNA interferase MazF
MASSKRPAVERGEVWLVALDPVIGSEQAKTRPCVVIQRDAANRTGATTIVIPFTAAARTTGIIAPAVSNGDGGLEKDSVALCHQIRVVDRLRLRTRLGRLSDRSMLAICDGVGAILDLGRM